MKNIWKTKREMQEMANNEKAWQGLIEAYVSLGEGGKRMRR